MPDEPKPITSSSLSKVNDSGNKTAEKSDETVDRPPWLIFAIFLGGIILFISAYGGSVFSTTLILVELLIGTACMSVGCLLGFLFGMPRTRVGSSTKEENEEDDQTYTPSNNLEQVSDWLTKILIGVGLVELRQIGGTLAAMGHVVAGSLAAAPSGTEVVTQVVIVTFLLFGFITSFLWTRIYYGPLQTITDKSLRDKLKEYKNKYLDQKETTEKYVDITKKLASGEIPTPAMSKETRQLESSLETTAEESGMPPEILEKIQRFKDTEPKWNSDPTADLFPKAPREKNGRVLEAEIDAKAGRALFITLRVRKTEGGAELEDEVFFLLHPTLTTPVKRIKPQGDKAEVDIYAEGWFTVVAILDKGQTVLSYDLRDLPGAPTWFKSN